MTAHSDHLERWLEVMGYDLSADDPDGDIVDLLVLYGRQACPRRERERLPALCQMSAPTQAQERNRAIRDLWADHKRHRTRYEAGPPSDDVPF